MTPTRWLIGTDLDGTLLDDRYDLDAAAAAVDAQQALGREVALASSKTLPEMRDLAGRCGEAPVLIFENGAGVAWPARFDRDATGEGYTLQLWGDGYERLCAVLQRLRRAHDFRFIGFADMSDADVAERTGLSSAAAALARQRRASEPLVWQDDDASLGEFRQRLAASGYQALEGGRFLHVMPRTDKAKALLTVRDALAERGDGPVTLLTAGDSPNDLAMLQAADVAVVFPRRDGSYLDLTSDAGVSPPLVVAGSTPGEPDWSETVVQAIAAWEARQAQGRGTDGS